MSELVAVLLQGVAGLNVTALYALAGLAMLGAALAVLLIVRARRSHAQQLPADGALTGSRVEPITGGRNERHDTAA